MSVSLIFTACNQGDWVRRTLPLARESMGGLQHEIIVVDDQSIDGCCHGLPRDVLVLRTHGRMGVSGARRFGAERAQGDVILYTDPHCEYPDQALAHLAKSAAKIPGIHQPSTRSRPDGPITHGGAFALSDRGLRIRGCFSGPSDHPVLINSIYALSRETHEALGGWPQLPGVWGCSEQALSLLAWFSDTPIHVDSGHACVHYAYQPDKRFPYHVAREDHAANVHCVHWAFFPEAYDLFWRPTLEQRWHEYVAPLRSNIFRSLRGHVQKLAKRTEDEFFRDHLRMAMPGRAVPAEADEAFIRQQAKRSSPVLYAQSRKRVTAAITWMVNGIAGCLKGRTALDLGTRDGYGVEELRRFGCREVAGVEVVPETAEMAASRTDGAVRQGDMRALSDPDARWDIVTCIHSLEHVPDPERARSEMVRVTKPGGWLLVVVPQEQEPSAKHAHNCAFATEAALRDFVLADERVDAETCKVETAQFWPTPPQDEIRLVVQRKRPENGQGRPRPRQLTKGLVYQLSSPPAAEVLTVSLWTLRQHYHGPVTIFTAEGAKEAAERIAADKRLDVTLQPLEMPQFSCYRADWTVKVFAYLQAPYDRNIWLDADTVVVQPIDDLHARGFHVAQLSNFRFADEQGYAPHVREYLASWDWCGPIIRGMIERAKRENVPLVNAGTLGFAREDSALYELHHLAIMMCRARQADEVALQILLPRIQSLNVLDESWNWSPRYSAHPERARIIHFHGRQWYRTENGRDLFVPHLQAALRANAGGLADWAGQYNENIRPLLAGAVQPMAIQSVLSDRSAVTVHEEIKMSEKSPVAAAPTHAGGNQLPKPYRHRRALDWFIATQPEIPLGRVLWVGAEYRQTAGELKQRGASTVEIALAGTARFEAAEGTFDAVISCYALESEMQATTRTAEYLRMLRSGGRLLILARRTPEGFADSRQLIRAVRATRKVSVRSIRAQSFKFHTDDWDIRLQCKKP